MERIIIAAVALNRVIGKENDLAWHLPADMKYFKECTKGFPVIMGRKNYESIPEKYRPLPGRLNIVMSHQKDYHVAEGVALCHDLQKALDIAAETGTDKVYIIGGGQVYKSAIEQGLVDKMLITWVEAEVKGDVYFPVFDEESWTLHSLMHHPKDKEHAFPMRFVEYVKD